MPGKSRKKGKYSIQSKKQVGTARPAAVVQPAEKAQIQETPTISNVSASPRVAPASPRVVPTRPSRGAEQMAKPMTVHLHVAKELRTIGILAGLMLILLVVLALILT